jgi:hypothetical protein
LAASSLETGWRMTTFKNRALVLLAAVLLAPVCFADHLPPKDQAKGRPEKKLAGIIIDRTKVSEVIRMYGKPSEVQKEPNASNLNVVDTYHYRWLKPGIKLHLVVFQFDKPRSGEYIALIEVEGSQAAGRLYRTGGGLKIGDELADLRRIYGPRYKVSNIPKLNIHDVMIQWRVEEFSLVAELDKKGKITKLSLFAPE